MLKTKTVLDLVRKQTDEVILFYSCGKDSIVLIDLLTKLFKRVVCVFMYFIKGLEHIEKYIKYSQKKYNNIEFIQLPHFSLSNIYKHGIYCTPNNNVSRILKISDIDAYVRQKTGIKFSFYGWKKADSLDRRIILDTYHLGSINLKTNKVYPLSSWKKNDVLSYIKLNNLPVPIKYSLNKSNGIGFNIHCLLFMREYYKNDLNRFLKKFPLAESILYEYDYKISNAV